jgi:cytochrome c-type biogenesis protein CcmF
LGTFITRSGLLTSVHAFATDPTRGVYILGFLAFIVGGSLLLYAIRAPSLKSEFGFGSYSREVFLLANNLILVVASAAILLGTLYPMVYQAMSGGDLISVGPPYFNTIFVPLMGVLVVFMGIGPISRWKKTSGAYLWKQLSKVALAAAALGIIVPVVLTMGVPLGTIGVVIFALWVVFAMLKDLVIKVSNKPTVRTGLKSLSLSYWGMQLAHFGFVLTMAGACLTSIYSIERSVLLQPGQSAALGNYTFVFEGTRPVQGPNYIADEATIRVIRGDTYLRDLYPQKRFYVASGSPATQMGIDGRFLRDLFITLGEPRQSGAWSMTLYVKPFVRWIWLGTLFIAFGGILAVTDKRYRRFKVKRTSEASDASSTVTGEQPI